MNKYPIYEPNKWNKNIYILNSHNCYAYCLNLIYPEYIDLCRKHNSGEYCGDYCKKVKSQPGLYAGIVKKSKKMNVEHRMMKDNPHIQKTDYNTECLDGYYKIALFVNSKDVSRYHFYREDKNKYWSHKSGWSKVSNKDDKNNIIKNPCYCERGEYDKFIGFYIVPIDHMLKNMANYFTMKKKL